MKKFNSKICEEIMTTVYKPIEFVVDNLLAQGLYILAGAPKVGKSWLALDVCLSIAKGEKVLGQQTAQGTALYLCLEDSFVRIQNRLYEITDEPTERLHFVIMSESIGNGLEEQIANFKKEHSDLNVVLIDTLPMVRNESESSYGLDYKELSVLKTLADKLGIAIVLVHHTRKCSDGDFKKWFVTDEPFDSKSKDNIFLAALYVYLKKCIDFYGTASELVTALKSVSDETFYPNRVTKDLVQNGYTLRKYGIDFQYKRTRTGRLIILHYDRECDSKNSTVVTVNGERRQYLANP